MITETQDIKTYDGRIIARVSTNAAPNVLVVDPSPAHLRSYDFNAGDERFFDREEAVSRARLRVKDRGCRQQVRRSREVSGIAGLDAIWLVQDI